MKKISSVMGNRRFSYFIILTFIAGSLLLIAVQINSAKNTKELIQNKNYVPAIICVKSTVIF
ncbi:hypothetical protein NG800_002455 [Epilithonimonas ginsengisoli]|uniref:Uncharacterized protein n=1 Tax=Epilithonimonas ginsengisoli TaxID=1245592 RepID=A0ABU4JDL8_9FLAO|nr:MULTISPECIES: hypothetical protein [Chryseobacterium group]MDW8547755.1 hypothetical protein [Epilithonimonas ginsengisoli]OAH76074.1 hypothetical protein AXA65_02155 [Chryseobacterium sp. FP211-J200]